MVLEIAEIEIKPGLEAEFEQAVGKAAAVFKRAKGCRSMRLQRCVERPSVYLLFVDWETIDNHMIDFRPSADIQEGRKLAGHCFAGTPKVEHMREVVKGV